MFKELEIQNFQSHKDTLLEFVPGINVIIGTSDSGKSAIFRALRWLMYNRPSGDSFCSYWSNKESKVKLVLDDHVIVRAKEKAKQIYLLDDLSFTAFKTEVPEEIVKALNMGEVNFQQQFDRPFLLDVSSGEVAQYFNKIAHLENIDKALKSLHQKERITKQNIDRYTEDKQKVEEDLEKYKDLEFIDQKLSVLEKAEIFINNIENEIEEITSIISQVGQLQEILKASPLLNSVIDMIKDILDSQKEFEYLELIVNQYREAEEQITKYQDINKCEALLDDVVNVSQSIMIDSGTEIQKLSHDIRTIVDVENAIKGTIDIIEELNTQLMKVMPEICPLCGNLIKK